MPMIMKNNGIRLFGSSRQSVTVGDVFARKTSRVKLQQDESFTFRFIYSVCFHSMRKT